MMLFRNRLLGGVRLPLPMFERPGEGAPGGDSGEDKHTDVVLSEIAGKAFDDLAGAADGSAVDRGEPAAKPVPTENPAGAEKPVRAAKDAADAGKTNPESPAAAAAAAGRDKNGRFAAKGAADGTAAPAEVAGKAAADAAAAAAKTGTEPPAGQEQQPAPAAAPPPGWSVASKAAWDKLPDAVKADIAKRELEVSNGFKEFEGLKPFAAHAKTNGQSLAQALGAYTGIEQLIRRDLGGGLMHIVRNSGKTQHEAATLFGELAERLGFQFKAPSAQPGGGSPGDQNPGADDPNMLQRLLAPVLEPILQKVNSIEGTFSRQAEGAKTQRQGEAQRVVDQFRSTPEGKFYDNVEEQVFNLLTSGAVKRTGDFAADLKAAYEAACMTDPEIRELLVNERLAAAGEQQRARSQETVDRARAASRSVTGAPAGGAWVIPKRGGGSGPDHLQQLAEQAYDQAAGRV